MYHFKDFIKLFQLQKLDDTVGPVRDSAAEAIGTAMKVVGERAMGVYIEGLDKIKQDKVLFIRNKNKLSFLVLSAVKCFFPATILNFS